MRTVRLRGVTEPLRRRASSACVRTESSTEPVTKSARCFSCARLGETPSMAPVVPITTIEAIPAVAAPVLSLHAWRSGDEAQTLSQDRNALPAVRSCRAMREGAVMMSRSCERRGKREQYLDCHFKSEPLCVPPKKP